MRQLQGLLPEDHLDEALGQVPGASTRGSTAGSREGTRPIPSQEPHRREVGPGPASAWCGSQETPQDTAVVRQIHMEWGAGGGEAAREGGESPSCTAGQETPQTSPPSKPGTQTVPAEPKGRVPETWS